MGVALADSCVRLARFVREHKVRFYAAVSHGLSNARVETPYCCVTTPLLRRCE